MAALQDSFGRTISYLRLSVTDRCGLRCRYCMPEGIRYAPEEDLLTDGEILTVCARAAELGIRRIRITGGEPLLREGCVSLTAKLKQLPGIRQVFLTTNGLLLEENLEGLLAAGIDGINVSLNSLDPEQYRTVTGADGADRVLRAIRLAAGRVLLKINCVILGGINGDAPEALAALARELPVDVRFIEMMPIGAGKNWEVTPNVQVLKRLEARFGKAGEVPADPGGGPAVYYCFGGFKGRIGLISAVHGPFCETCNRLRLTCTGDLKPCLCYGETIPLRPILRSPEAGEEERNERIRNAIREAVREKPPAHCFDCRDGITESRKMAQIGG